MSDPSNLTFGAESASIALSGSMCEAIAAACDQYGLEHCDDEEGMAFTLLAACFRTQRMIAREGGTSQVTLTLPDFSCIEKACLFMGSKGAVDRRFILLASMARSLAASCSCTATISELIHSLGTLCSQYSNQIGLDLPPQGSDGEES